MACLRESFKHSSQPRASVNETLRKTSRFPAHSSLVRAGQKARGILLRGIGQAQRADDFISGPVGLAGV